jgi:hypothetical protein
MTMTEAAAQRVEFTAEEHKIADDIVVSDDWLELENRIIDLLIEFPGGRRVIADWLRDEADAVESTDESGKYAHPRVLRADTATEK